MNRPYLSRADIIAIFALKDRAAVDDLIRAGILEVSAWSPGRQPLFSRESVVRCARRIVPRPAQRILPKPEPPSAAAASR